MPELPYQKPIPFVLFVWFSNWLIILIQFWLPLCAVFLSTGLVCYATAYPTTFGESPGSNWKLSSVMEYAVFQTVHSKTCYMFSTHNYDEFPGSIFYTFVSFCCFVHQDLFRYPRSVFYYSGGRTKCTVKNMIFPVSKISPNPVYSSNILQYKNESLPNYFIVLNRRRNWTKDHHGSIGARRNHLISPRKSASFVRQDIALQVISFQRHSNN